MRLQHKLGPFITPTYIAHIRKSLALFRVRYSYIFFYFFAPYCDAPRQKGKGLHPFHSSTASLVPLLLRRKADGRSISSLVSKKIKKNVMERSLHLKVFFKL